MREERLIFYFLSMLAWYTSLASIHFFSFQAEKSSFQPFSFSVINVNSVFFSTNIPHRRSENFEFKILPILSQLANL